MGRSERRLASLALAGASHTAPLGAMVHDAFPSCLQPEKKQNQGRIDELCCRCGSGSESIHLFQLSVVELEAERST